MTSKKWMHCPVAKVFRLIPGKDDKIRTVELKTQTGAMLRPIQRVYPLEILTTPVASWLEYPGMDGSSRHQKTRPLQPGLICI
ncbi:hypothetical protein TNCV_4912311 [Trichonephila clavipes]|nr:hypothetical protein TNCV_4912311 [Trichonephila clavipes]